MTPSSTTENIAVPSAVGRAFEWLNACQRADGSWPPEANDNTAMYGSSLTTALSVLSLTPPYQLLPVYQR